MYFYWASFFFIAHILYISQLIVEFKWIGVDKILVFYEIYGLLSILQGGGGGVAFL